MEDRIEEGGSTTRPSLLTESNYDYWKNRMKWFLKSQDEAIWRATQVLWKPPTVTADGVEDIKSEDQWTIGERALCTANSKAVGIIQCAVRPSVYKIIQNFETAKESWDALQLTYEGSSSVKQSKLHIISNRFESLTMKDDETIAEFEKNLRYIANESTALGEVIPESKLVRKVLISLPEKFNSKMDAISESTEFKNLRFDDLMGKIRTYEMTLDMRSRDKAKPKSVAFRSGVETAPVRTEEEQFVRDQLTLITKNMGKMYRKFNKPRYRDYSSPNVQKDNRSLQSKTELGGIGQRFKQGETSEARTRLKKEKIQCHECQGFGHMAAKCANTLEKQKKSFISTWSDEETTEDGFETSDDESEIEFPAHKALTAHTPVTTGPVRTDKSREIQGSENDSDSDEDEGIHTAFKNLLEQMSESLRINHLLVDENDQLKEERRDFDKIVEKYEAEINSLKSNLAESEKKVEEANHVIKRFNQGKGKLDEILTNASPKNNIFGIGHNAAKMEKGNTSGHKNRGAKRRIVCHYCDRPGHIRPWCYKRQNDIRRLISTLPEKAPKKRVDVVNHSQPRVWVPKKELKSLMCRSSSKHVSDWYFDSGCSQHMTGEEDLLKNIVFKNRGTVTYGDGSSNSIIGEGNLPVSSKAKIKNVLLVEGLKHNLISIAQICDEDCEVSFKKHGCRVINDQGTVVMTGTRQSDNTYTLNEDMKCLKTGIDNLQSWHKKLGHVSYRKLADLSKTGSVKGLPVLAHNPDITCGDCQLGKQTREKHTKVSFVTTERPLQLLHIDLMGPMQTTSLGGKTYAFVCVDDFSRFTWVDFLKEKSDAPNAIIKLCTKLNNDRRNTTGTITRIRSDHGKEFENAVITAFCEHSGIAHEFSAPITPQQNGVVERKNRSITEMARTMIHAKKLSYKLWGEAMSTACYIINRVHLRPHLNKTPYEIWKQKKPSVKYFHEFGSLCYVLKDRDPRRKLDSKSERGVFVGYSHSVNSRAYRIFIERTNTITESINVVFDDKQVNTENDEDCEPGTCQLWTSDNTPSVGALGTEGANGAENTPSVEAVPVSTDTRNTQENLTAVANPNVYPSIRIQKNHSADNIIGNISERSTRGVPRKNYRDMINYVAYTSKIEPRKVEEALKDEH
ncbi:uncharacterized protein [Rutidosis leptorrhynchoides]|uniref:uncharacterized protein n=1 Tax=Rutidosis leptorrhynchoides TaxID=125765 RepID=UPI003A9A3508